MILNELNKKKLHYATLANNACATPCKAFPIWNIYIYICAKSDSKSSLINFSLCICCSASHAEERSNRRGETACGCPNTNLLELRIRLIPQHVIPCVPPRLKQPSDVTSRTMHAQTEIWRSHVQQQQQQAELELELTKERPENLLAVPGTGTVTRNGTETGIGSESATRNVNLIHWNWNCYWNRHCNRYSPLPALLYSAYLKRQVRKHNTQQQQRQHLQRKSP